MGILYVAASFAALLCVTVVIAADHESHIGEEEILSIAKCVATSADQPFCDEFVKCFDLFPKLKKDAFQECMEKLSVSIGQCTEDQELFNSEEDRKNVMFGDIIKTI
ncbi:hypothetical protein NPIL_622381 [Nephila pilipes]|uniref:Uncharacterized protein n=1 Tax=Nephila pilipes TaxID=299642 RepID=A0A8X6PEY6_NEPPI|nr:hypothetical protein NPIL_622381 [Nephila pilipes]